MLQRLKRLLSSSLSKSSSDEWVAGFGAGYRAAWDTMFPLMREGVEKSKDAIRTAAIDETIARLDATIAQRLENTGRASLQPVAALLSKQEQFRLAKDAATTLPEDQVKYEHYLTCLDWMLNGHNLRPH